MKDNVKWIQSEGKPVQLRNFQNNIWLQKLDGLLAFVSTTHMVVNVTVQYGNIKTIVHFKDSEYGG